MAQLRRVKQAIRDEVPPICGDVDQVALTANVAATYTVPDDVHLVGLASTAGTPWARADGSGSAAVIPAATISNGSGSFKVLDGTTREVWPGLAISFICSVNSVIVIEKYQTTRSGVL